MDFSTSCLCTPDQGVICDPFTGRMTCDHGIHHCLLVIKLNESNNEFISHIQGCWSWPTDPCPSEPGVCYSLSHEDGKYVSCCCKGDYCNNPANVTIKKSLSASSPIPGIESPPLLEPTGPATRAEAFSFFSENSIFLSVVLVPVFLIFLLFAASCVFVQRRYSRTKIHKRPFVFKSCQRLGHAFPSLYACFSRRSSYTGGIPSGNGPRIPREDLHCPNCMSPNGLTVRSPCIDCGRDVFQSDTLHHLPSPKRPIHGSGRLAEGEIENLAKICTKERICSRGRFGEVWYGKMTPVLNADSQPSPGPSTKIVDVAIKVFLTSEKRSWETELELYRLPRLPHPNILHYIGVDVVPRNESTDEDDAYCTGNGSFECWLVTDFLPLGSVYDYIRSTELSWGEMLRIAVGMARGLSHLHTELPHTAFQEGKPSIAHRDFKSRNVLLKSDLTACISDMGLAIILESGKCIGDAHLQVGTRRYMAPEVLDGAIQFTRDAFLRIDVYALGLVIWELMTRCRTSQLPLDDDQPLPPYMAPYEAELGSAPAMEQLQHWVAQRKKRPPFLDRWRKDQGFLNLWDTVRDSWDQDAEARLTAGCIAERIHNLQRQFIPCESDPVHRYPPLSAPDCLTPVRVSLEAPAAANSTTATTTTVVATNTCHYHSISESAKHVVQSPTEPSLTTANATSTAASRPSTSVPSSPDRPSHPLSPSSNPSSDHRLLSLGIVSPFSAPDVATSLAAASGPGDCPRGSPGQTTPV